MRGVCSGAHSLNSDLSHTKSMAKEKRQGFQSSAGLIRYFDSESDKSLKLSPYLVIGMAIASVVIVTTISLIWPI